jgi:hypothetical protein
MKTTEVENDVIEIIKFLRNDPSIVEPLLIIFKNPKLAEMFMEFLELSEDNQKIAFNNIKKIIADREHQSIGLSRSA